MEGSEALAEAAIAAGCRFFAGYPMTPFTELLEAFAAKLPGAGGACVNAESELEAVGMAWGASATGARAATGSTGQGLALMQESFSELVRAELPLVVFNMARGQFDYRQATKGGGHGDYHFLVLAPLDVREAVELVQRAFELAEKWRNPVLLYGDYLLAHTAEAVEVPALQAAMQGSSAPSGAPALVPRSEPKVSEAADWAADGTGRARGGPRHVSPIGMQPGAKGIDAEAFWRRLAAKHARMAAEEARAEVEHAADTELLVVAFGSLARFARHAVRELRREGARVGFFRPITLWPFPSQALAAAAQGARRVAVLEQNAGQMIDDVRLALLGRSEVVPIGGISTDAHGFGIGGLFDPAEVRARIEGALAGRAA
jgi:2-oxoglutarate ferredoxin oxidoreductase subunit alpha